MISPKSCFALFLLSASAALHAQTISYNSGFTAGELATVGSAKVNGTALQLTDLGGFEAASAFYATPVNVQSFTSNFTFRLSNANADGFAFVLQNAGPRPSVAMVAVSGMVRIVPAAPKEFQRASLSSSTSTTMPARAATRLACIRTAHPPR